MKTTYFHVLVVCSSVGSTAFDLQQIFGDVFGSKHFLIKIYMTETCKPYKILGV